MMPDLMHKEAVAKFQLKRSGVERALAGRPWFYRGNIESKPSSGVAPEEGDLIELVGSRGRPLGLAFYHSKSKIAARWIARSQEKIDQNFFVQRISEAQKLRERWIPGATSYRLVSSEADLMSGLTVDRYEDTLVVQITSAGMERRKDWIVAALVDLFKPKTILEKSDTASREMEKLEKVSGVLYGDSSGPLRFKLAGLEIELDLLEGHKTGAYLDQQQNYQQVAQMAKGKRVLDCFTFLGGFALKCAQAGATKVVAVDQSEGAIESAKRNAELNGLTGKVQWDKANVFDWLRKRTQSQKEVARSEELFDLIILDPPSFTRSRQSIPDAVRGYKEIHLRALKLLAPGGVIATFCCSHHIDDAVFLNCIEAASNDAHRSLRLVETYSQSLDHPVVLQIPESRYLKGFALESVN